MATAALQATGAYAELNVEEVMAELAKMLAGAATADLPKLFAEIQTTVTLLIALKATWTTNAAAVVTTETLLTSQRNARDGNLSSIRKNMTYLRSQVTAKATTPDQVTQMAMGVAGEAPKSAAFPAPDGLTFILPKSKKTPIRSHVTDTLKRRLFVAQSFVGTVWDANTVWVTFAGHGMTHQLTGYASGAHVWVRYAATKGQLQSDFCAPVMIVMP